MYNSALLVIEKAISRTRLLKLFEFAKCHITERVYISLSPTLTHNIADYLFYIKTCYRTAETLCSSSGVLDVRFLLPSENSTPLSLQRTRQADLLIVDSFVSDDEAVRRTASRLLKTVPPVLLHANVEASNSQEDDRLLVDDYPESPYEYLALGGTFDRLHNGHKILLSVGALLCNQMLTVGMTTEKMLAKKTLCELIEPLSLRIQNVQEFLNDIKPGLDYHIFPLDDPWGPPAHDPRYQALVCSPETKPGCEKINSFRREKNFSPCKIHMIDFVDDPHRDVDHEEEKVSSSSRRKRMLGTLLRSPDRSYVDGSEPYIIGLTGGIGSGKSSVGKKLESLGARLIDCDILGHEAYKKGTTCYRRLVEVFGNEIVNPDDQEIDRRNLGGIVFGDKEKMKTLTSIVWPEIRHLAKNRITQVWESAKDSGKPCVIVLEAAVLIDAGWQNLCHEVWTTFIPREEAITRLGDRNKLSREQAIQRLDSQRTNKDYILAANVVICTLWEHEYTLSQLKKAWRLLHERMNANIPSDKSRL